MLLNQPDSTTNTTITTSSTIITSSAGMDNKPDHLTLEDHFNMNQNSALCVAACNGHKECVKLLLSSGFSPDISHENGFTPLHFSAANGHTCCVEELLAAGAAVDSVAADGQTSLFVACEAGWLGCARALLDAGADRSLTTTDGCTPLHAAVRSGHVEVLRLLLCHKDPSDPSASPHFLAPPATLLNQANRDGWTAAHMAAVLGLKDCLEVLCSHSDQDIERKDTCNRTIHDVATDDCKDLLENLHSYRVVVVLQSPRGGRGSLCPFEALEESSGHVVLGRMTVHRGMRWDELRAALSRIFTTYLQIICGESLTAGELEQHSLLGLGFYSFASVRIGDTEWLPSQEPPFSPWDLIRKPLSQRISICLKGLSESCFDELALESLLSRPLLQNFVRLVEQYGNLIFHGLEGSCQDYFASLVACCIKSKQEAAGVSCDVVKVEVKEDLTKEQLLQTFISCGFLVPAMASELRVTSRCVVVLLEGLEKTPSMTGLLGDLCHNLENRGSTPPLVLSSGPHHFSANSFLIATLSKACLQGSELRLQQHFRWVSLRWDQEPLHGLLGRHLRRKLLHETGTDGWTPDGTMEQTVMWVSQVWQRLNACLSRLGTHEALLGPQLFLSCPVVHSSSETVVRWLARLWNAMVVPRLEEAVISRLTGRRSSSSFPCPPSAQHLSPGKQELSAGQQAVVKATLSILVNKAVMPGCSLPPHEISRYMLEFQGSAFPLSALGSYDEGGGGRRRARDTGKLRRSNTSPRKKQGPSLKWSSGGSFRESSPSVVFHPNGLREPAALPAFCDIETDLIRELQTMCSSRSEPDISKICRAKDEQQHPQPADLNPLAVRQQEQTTTPVQPGSSQRTGPRVRSQLPVPSSRGQQARAFSACSSSSSASDQTRRPPGRRSSSHSSSRAEHGQPDNNNYYSSNLNHKQAHQDIWILHRDPQQQQQPVNPTHSPLSQDPYVSHHS